MLCERLELDRRRTAEAGQIEPCDAIALGERRQHGVEDCHLRKQRMQKEERAAAAALLVFDRSVAELEERHYGSRFFAGGNSRE